MLFNRPILKVNGDNILFKKPYVGASMRRRKERGFLVPCKGNERN
jgi:hypothetical protein